MEQVVSSPARVDEVALSPGDKSVSHRAALLNDRRAPNAGNEAVPAWAVAFAPNALSADGAGQQARACANLAIAALGDRAAYGLHYLPTDANVLGEQFADLAELVAVARGQQRNVSDWKRPQKK